MKPLRMFIAVCFAFLVIGNHAATADECDPPRWVDQPLSVATGDSYAASGDGSTAAEALDTARGHLAQMISARVTSESKSSDLLLEKNGEIYSSQSVLEATEVVADLVLRGIEPVANRRVCDVYYAAVVLSKSDARAQLEEQDGFMENLKLALDGRMTELESSVLQNTTRIAAVETLSQSNAAEIESVNEVIAQLQAQILAFGLGQGGQGTRIGGLDRTVAELREKLDVAKRAPSGEAKDEALRDLQRSKEDAISFSAAFAAYQLGDYESARRAYRELCTGGSAASCLNLGHIYDLGAGTPRDLQRASQYYAKSCEMGAGVGCTNLASLYALGDGVEQDLDKSHHYYSRGCELGDGYGCSSLASVYRFGNGVERNVARATELYEKACEMNDGYGCSSLGTSYKIGQGVTKDIHRASTYYELGCKLGYAKGCSKLGDLYENGQDDLKDLSLARVFHERGCELGDGDVCLDAGQFYLEALGADRNRGLELWQLGCNDGVEMSCWMVARFHENGWGGTRNLALARESYQRACDLGYTKACEELRQAAYTR
jgi:TPR repeat protein